MNTIRRTVIACFVTVSFASAQNEWVLQPWVQVEGTVNGQQLGKHVTGISPASNLPYRAAVSKTGSTGLYLLATQNDTTIQQVFLGEDLLTGDLNNDGYVDVVVSKTVNDWDTVFVYWGTALGIDTMDRAAIPGGSQFIRFGARCVGDVNNDGFDDLVITANLSTSARGRVDIHLGPAIDPIPNVRILGDTTLSRLGGAATVGDLNNDGWNDLVVRGWHNPTSGPSYDYINVYNGLAPDSVNTVPVWTLKGYPLTSQGLACFDANADGIDDLLWTNRDSTNSLNYIAVHFGGTSFDTIPSMRLQSPDFVGGFGGVITSAGDMNGDSQADILVGGDQGTITSGFVFVFSGGSEIDGYFDGAVGQSTNSKFGWSVAGIGDINGDGLSDIIVGAPEYDFGTNKGYWGIFLGDTNIPVTSVEIPDKPHPFGFFLFPNYPNPFNSRTTIAYRLEKPSLVRLTISNLLGQELETLVGQKQRPGEYRVEFEADKYPSGVYLYKLTVTDEGGVTQTRTNRMIYIK